MIRLHYARWVLYGACFLLLGTNVITIAADLRGVGEAAAMVTGLRTVQFTSVIVSFLFWSSYTQIARVFKWITLVLFADVITAFFAPVDRRSAFAATVLPRLSGRASRSRSLSVFLVRLSRPICFLASRAGSGIRVITGA